MTLWAHDLLHTTGLPLWSASDWLIVRCTNCHLLGALRNITSHHTLIHLLYHHFRGVLESCSLVVHCTGQPDPLSAAYLGASPHLPALTAELAHTLLEPLATH
jgi:hypothetical protein